jgi:hypothetical protein
MKCLQEYILLSNGKIMILDLYLPKEDFYVEVKGYLTPTCKEKLNLFAQEYPKVNLKIIDIESYKKLKELFEDKVEKWEN